MRSCSLSGSSCSILRSGQDSIFARAKSIITHQDNSSQERLALWSKSWQLFKQHPLSGVGIGNWKVVCPGLGLTRTNAETGDVYFQQPHNDYLWVLTETGVFGLTAYSLIYFLALGYAVRALLRRPSQDEAVFVLLLLFAMICYLVDSFFHYPRERVELVMFSTLILSAIVSIHHRLQPSPGRVSRSIVAVSLTA
ncbi:MAG: O-antigen ligase family protein, partial [candidate division Zixibacteria bacterium]|nr:O-antigen ligase family protein [candidate division Zixibacteria bacterium]